MLSDADVIRLRAERHRHAEEVLERVITNEPLMAQVHASLEDIKRGVVGVGRKQIQADTATRRDG